VYAILSLLVPQQLEMIGLVSNVPAEKFGIPYHLLTNLRHLRNIARDYIIRVFSALVTNIMRFVHAFASLNPLTHLQIGVKFRPMYRHLHRKRLFRWNCFGKGVSAFGF
jgi:hypothetical protein